VTEFVFMLTRDDQTVPDAHDILDSTTDVRLRHIGFKDVGLPFAELRSLTDRIRELGALSYLEVVSEDIDDELHSIDAALDLGVDVILGGTHVDRALRIIGDAPVEYWPFPGEVAGHPSQLRGDLASVVASARDHASQEGVDGLDLLAYRFAGDVPALVRAVVDAVDVPVLAAGSVDSAERIAALRSAGVWGFTVGTAIVDRTIRIPRTIPELLTAVLRANTTPAPA
jgi:hypothetical protein